MLMENNRLLDISSAKLDLFGVNKELQFRICNDREPCKCQHGRGTEESFTEGTSKLRGL